MPETDPNTEVTPDGQVGGGGQAPPPTPEGMAQELGRIEQKLLLLLNRQPPEDSGGGGELPDLSELLDLLRPETPETRYGISPVCDLDANGQPLPRVEVVVPGGDSLAEVLINRLDALAELIDLHKALRQPVCRNPAAQGQEVTVWFQEVE